MSAGNVKIFTQTLTTGATLTSALDLQTRPWTNIYLDIPTMASASDFYIQGSAENDNYRRIMHPVINGQSDPNTFIIGSAAANKIVPIPNGVRFIKIELSTALTSNSLEFRLICSD